MKKISQKMVVTQIVIIVIINYLAINNHSNWRIMNANQLLRNNKNYILCTNNNYKKFNNVLIKAPTLKYQFKIMGNFKLILYLINNNSNYNNKWVKIYHFFLIIIIFYWALIIIQNNKAILLKLILLISVIKVLIQLRPKVLEILIWMINRIALIYKYLKIIIIISHHQYFFIN